MSRGEIHTFVTLPISWLRVYVTFQPQYPDLRDHVAGAKYFIDILMRWITSLAVVLCWFDFLSTIWIKCFALGKNRRFWTFDFFFGTFILIWYFQRFRYKYKSCLKIFIRKKKSQRIFPPSHLRIGENTICIAVEGNL